MNFFKKKYFLKENSIEKVNFLDIYNESIEKELNSVAKEFRHHNNVYINELFIYFYRPYYAIKEKINKMDAYEIDEKLLDRKTRAFLYGINSKKFSLTLSYRSRNFVINLKYILLGLFNICFFSFGLIMYVIVNSFLTKIEDNNKEILIIERSDAAASKLSTIKDKIDAIHLVEKIKLKNSFYSFVRKRDFFSLVFFITINSFIDLIKIMMFAFNNFEIKISPYIFYYYSKRIPYSNLYEFALKKVLKKGGVKVLYTANNIDRFALIEEKLANIFSVKLVNIPHGIEYGFTLPHCFTGDEFYALSSSSASYLNELYKTNKFIYSEQTVNLMLNKNFHKEECFYVYFTEPYEIEVNIEIIRLVKDFANTNNKKLYLKLHPKDKFVHYEKLEIEEIKNFNSAITNNICLARKSTVLLEAIYNNSQAIAVLLNEKDEFGIQQFPSLGDSKIRKARSSKQLINILQITLEVNEGVQNA